MNSSSAGDGVRLLYDWAGRQDYRRRLTLGIVLALILHAGGYVVFRAAYPDVPVIEPSTAGILILLPDSAAGRALAPTIAAADPALFATDRSATFTFPDPAVPAYRPSFENARVALRPLPESGARILPPLPRDSGPVFVGDGRAPDPPPSAPPARATTVVVSGGLSGRRVDRAPVAAFTARPGDWLKAANFLIAVDGDGTVRHVFEESGTASPEINAVAVPFLLGHRFAPVGGSGLTWGTATIHWGTDVRRERLR